MAAHSLASAISIHTYTQQYSYMYVHICMCTYIHADSSCIIVCVGHLNATLCWIFNLMYLINHVDPFSPPHSHTAMNCLTPARDRVVDPVPKSLPTPPPPPPFLVQPICNPILCSCFVFLLFFFFSVVFRSSCCHSFFCCFPSFKPLSNASSFFLASPVDGLLIFHSLWGFLLCSHIFITAYRFQTKDWLAVRRVKSSLVRSCQK